MRNQEIIDRLKKKAPLDYQRDLASRAVQCMYNIIRLYEEHKNANFQSMVAVGLGKGNGSETEKMMDYLIHLSVEIAAKRLDYAYEEYYYSCIGNMIGNEMGAASDDYYVFYRTVGTKLMFYELNTLVISMFSDNDHGLNFNKVQEHNKKALPLICTHSLIDDVYPDSVADVISLFNARGCDDTKQMNEILLSANNCLEIFPTAVNSFYIRPHYHAPEASPMEFFYGYDGSQTWKITMQEFLTSFFELSPDGVEMLIKAISNLYFSQYTHEHAITSDDNIEAAGHCIQIFIPKEYATKFAYSSFAWGHPASVFALSDGKHAGQHTYHYHSRSFSAPPPNAEDVLDFHDIMTSEDMAKVQTRIIGHPNLYMQHGAFTKVISGNPQFNRKTFQDGLRQLLSPLILKALAKGKQLKYSKFTNDHV
jgi:hypothetical protein